MARGRKAPSRKPLAPKDTNIPNEQHQRRDAQRQLVEANNREAERRIAAIEAVRDADVEGFLAHLRVARSMLPEEVLDMRLRDFVNKFCPGRQVVRAMDSGIIQLTSSSSILHPDEGLHFHYDGGTKEHLLGSVDRYLRDEIEGQQLLMKASESSLTTPSSLQSNHLMVGATPRTLRLPKKGEPLMSVNGSPLGIFGKEEITAIPEEERPRKARRRLRASALLEE